MSKKTIVAGHMIFPVGGEPIHASLSFPHAMKFLKWNFMGLGKTGTFLALKRMVNKHNPQSVFFYGDQGSNNENGLDM